MPVALRNHKMELEGRTDRTCLGDDFRYLIVNKLKKLGGNVDTGAVSRGGFTYVSKQLGIHKTSVMRIWRRFCATKSVKAAPHCGGRQYVTLKPEHRQYILFLVRETPSISLGDIKKKLNETCNVQVSKQAISTFIRKTQTRKRLVRPAAERFTDRNLIYTQAFVDVLHRTDPNRIKFFDESGFKLPDVCNPRYGHSLKGERAIEVLKYAQTPNVTLNLLISFTGVSYANVIEGASNTDTYTQFFFDALNSTTNEGEFCLKPGDMVVVDNCPIHRHRAENILAPFLDRLGIEYIFTPTYSPNLNAAELCFQHIKTLFKRKDIRAMAFNNLEYTVMYCVNSIKASDCKGYYQHIGYLNI